MRGFASKYVPAPVPQRTASGRTAYDAMGQVLTFPHHDLEGQQ